MDKNFVDGVIDGDITFGEYFDVPYVKVEELRYPVMLLGKNQEERNEYKGRRVRIQKDSLFLPDKNYGIFGSKKYIFPDATQDVTDLVPALEILLNEIDVDAKYNVLDEKGEDSFLYGASTFDVNNGRIFFLRLTKYKEEYSMINFVDWMNIPYTALAGCFQEGKLGIRKSESYITHFAEKFVIAYSGYPLQDDKADEARRLMSDNINLKALDDQLGRALADPLYMESLCKKIEKMVAKTL